MQIVNYKELQQETGVEYYQCGSPNLCKFLVGSGCKYINVYTISRKGKKRNIWVFIKSKELKQLLVEWSKNKPTKNVGDERG